MSELGFLLQDSLRQGSKILGVLSSEMCRQQVKMSAIWPDPYLPPPILCLQFQLFAHLSTVDI